MIIEDTVVVGGGGGGEGGEGSEGSEGGDIDSGGGGAAPQLTVTSATATSPPNKLPYQYSNANDGE